MLYLVYPLIILLCTCTYALMECDQEGKIVFIFHVLCKKKKQLAKLISRKGSKCASSFQSTKARLRPFIMADYMYEDLH